MLFNNYPSEYRWEENGLHCLFCHVSCFTWACEPLGWRACILGVLIDFVVEFACQYSRGFDEPTMLTAWHRCVLVPHVLLPLPDSPSSQNNLAAYLNMKKLRVGLVLAYRGTEYHGIQFTRDFRSEWNSESYTDRCCVYTGLLYILHCMLPRARHEASY